MARDVSTGTDGCARACARRLAFLVDARSYFDRLACTLERARRSILVAGWDVHSRVRLRRAGGDRETLAHMLTRLTNERPQLQAHLLIWDCNVLCAAEREKLQSLRFGWGTSSRVRFHLDDAHRVGACHHEKVVVVDDRVAFIGGMDLTARRWDTRDHAPDDERRVDPAEQSYAAYHDVQAMVSGEAAQELGRMVRARWARATGERLEAPECDGDPWPPDESPAVEDVTVGYARTDTCVEGQPAVRQVEAMYEEALRSAERSVYLENQYLTSEKIARVLAELLRRPQGPEVCVVTPLEVSGWLEDAVMGRLRADVVARLRDADRHDRFRIWYPCRDDGGAIVVHSKVGIVDDRFLTIGSANLSNRSLGLDTECNLFLQAADDLRVARAVTELRDGLLAEHLGCGRDRLARQAERAGSLNRAIEGLRGEGRSLRPLEIEGGTEDDLTVTAGGVLDPERPLDWAELVQRFFGGRIAD
jgi:phosphatidylserine/phosphatidylglycerophosphate/cardiolipin synthase-like enzyme